MPLKTARRQSIQSRWPRGAPRKKQGKCSSGLKCASKELSKSPMLIPENPAETIAGLGQEERAPSSFRRGALPYREESFSYSKERGVRRDKDNKSKRFSFTGYRIFRSNRGGEKVFGDREKLDAASSHVPTTRRKFRIREENRAKQKEDDLAREVSEEVRRRGGEKTGRKATGRGKRKMKRELDKTRVREMVRKRNEFVRKKEVRGRKRENKWGIQRSIASGAIGEKNPEVAGRNFLQEG
ncbi:hypothetical protein KM043_000395 [Ampulex compressa]|nr:hypothetical protein KM043_000395 [Ampulex compressa]